MADSVLREHTEAQDYRSHTSLGVPEMALESRIFELPVDEIRTEMNPKTKAKVLIFQS